VVVDHRLQPYINARGREVIKLVLAITVRRPFDGIGSYQRLGP